MSRAPLLLLALLAAPACTGLETGNGHAPPTLVAALSVTDAHPVDQTGAAFTLDAVRANVRHITFDLPDGASCVGLPGLVAESGSDAAHTAVCASGGDAIRLVGPWVVDLLTGEATPAIPRVNVQVGTYRRIDVRFDDADPDDGVVSPADPLAGATLVASGTVALADDGATPYALTLKFNEDARFESTTGILLAEDDHAAVLLALDPSAWFAGLPLATCADDGDLEIRNGVLVIEDGSGSCSDVENTLKDAIKASGELAFPD